ncbi:urokinase plasminogen activator surface receptor isoform X2 [Xenopus laevis]|uniref:Urokinase plasminogen activator surface receptor isoform X2 n=1 Tax=Xenopus laevis TaxID=8355 RepID=A0A8J0TCJ5_XENLA|nr:urokinase plasminogen activator surface receptor isoform X2 [Xenopus laevis]
MKLLLLCNTTSALLSVVFCLNCYQYNGPADHALNKQKRTECKNSQHYCSSTLITLSGFLYVKVLVKGCTDDKAGACNKTETGRTKDLETQRRKLCCDTELCNKELEPDLGADAQKWGTECLACNGSPTECGGGGLPSLRCETSKSNCIQVSIATAVEKETHKVMIKSCSNSSTCPGTAAFSNGHNPVTYASHHECCNGTHCNNGHFTGPSPDNILMSGCATQAFCQGLYPHFLLPGWTSTVCCSETLCNHGNTTGPPTRAARP